MNIFHKVSLQGLKKNKARTFVTVVGVILSTALITAVTSFGISLLSYMVQGSILKKGGWHAAFTSVDASFLQEQMEDSSVSDVASYVNIGYATLEGGQNPDKPYLFLAGFSSKSFDALPIEMIAGRLPQNSGEVIVPMSVSANGGVKLSIGDLLDLQVGIRQEGGRTLSQHDPYCGANETLLPIAKQSYTIVGTYQRPFFEEMTAPGYTLITAADSSLIQPDGAGEVCFTAFVTLKNPFRVHSYAKEHQAEFLNNDVLRFMGLSDDRLFTMLLLVVGVIVILIIMVGSVFLIYNAFHISLNERTHQLGILMSVGATAKQLQNAVLFEGLCIGAAGIPAGILAGLAGMGAVLKVVNTSFANVLYENASLTLVISIPAIGAAAAISMLTILISAWLPAHKAVRTPVMECIRQTNEVKTEAKKVKTSALAAHIYGLEGILALKNFKRNKSRYRSIVLSLVLSVVLFVSVNAFVIDLKQASEMAVVFTTFDISLDARSMEDAVMLPLYENLKKIDGVYESGYQEVLTYSLIAKGSDFSKEGRQIIDVGAPEEETSLFMNLHFLDDDTYLGMVEQAGLRLEEYTGEHAKLLALAKIDDHIERLRQVDEFADLFRGDRLEASIVPVREHKPALEQAQPVSLTFVDLVFPDIVPSMDQKQKQADTPYILSVAAPYSIKEKFQTQAASVYSRGLTFRSDHPADAVKKIEREILEEKITEDYFLLNVSNMLDSNNNMIFIANVFAYTFVVMISLIAVANVFNTISTNIRMRKRELAMLRSVGMSERDFQKMMNFECVFYGARALAVGIPVSLLFSWLIYLGIAAGGADAITFVLPWASMGISAAGVLLIVFVTMLYATSKIKKENIIDALRDEMT
ncbi:MAG: ABC transporter permease [Eubacterium sp.]|nr:ABC transporter permease [Eubacterium sp.]